VRHLELAVFGDRVVQRDDGRNDFFDRQNVLAEALVVVHEVEVGGALTQCAIRAQAERERFGEGALQEIQRFERVGPVVQLPIRGESPGILIVEDVEARQLVQRDARVEHRVRLAAVDLHVVPEVDERLGEMPRVHALATDVRLAAIGEIRKSQRTFAQTVELALHVAPRHAL